MSADGSTWTTLPADTFGSGSAIVSVAASHDGVVALTLELGLDFCDDPPSSSVTCYDLTGPLRSWTSTDGTSWTAHPVDAPPPPEMTGDDEEHPVLESGVAPLLLLRSENRWQAVSNDGATWERLARRVFPRGMHVEGATAIAGRYVGVGNADGHPTELSSEDGRHWDAAPMRSCGGISASETAQALTSGPDGMIAQGFKQLENGVGAWAWCWSRDGRPWRQLPGFPPLGAWDGNDECRDVCPDGILVGDGEHLIAYGGDATQAAWASLDGRRWEPLRVTGSQPPRRRSGRYPLTMHLLPLGLLAQGDLGKTAWLGVPKP